MEVLCYMSSTYVDSYHVRWHLDRVVYCTGLQNLGSCIAVLIDTNYPIGRRLLMGFSFIAHLENSLHQVA